MERMLKELEELKAQAFETRKESDRHDSYYEGIKQAVDIVKNCTIHGVVGSKDVQLMRDRLLKSREDTARVREATAIKQTLEIYCDHDELPTVNEVLERIGRKH